jgi:hypothetical protein
MRRRRTTKNQRPNDPSNDAFRGLACSLGGVDCYLWFDEDGELHGTGPKEARRNLESLLYRYTPLMKSKKVIDCVSELGPLEPGDPWTKKVAVFSLMLDAQARGDRPEDAVLAKELVERRIAKLRELPSFGCAYVESLHELGAWKISKPKG